MLIAGGVLGGGGFLRRRGWRGLGGAGLRLRSGAFAPDCPFVIFVTAFGCSFRFPRAHLHAPLPPSPATPGSVGCHFTGVGAGGLLGVLAKSRAGSEGGAGSPKAAARAAFFGIWVCCVGAVPGWLLGRRGGAAAGVRDGRRVVLIMGGRDGGWRVSPRSRVAWRWRERGGGASVVWGGLDTGCWASAGVVAALLAPAPLAYFVVSGSAGASAFFFFFFFSGSASMVPRHGGVPQRHL